jgi:hypothetical protein
MIVLLSKLNEQLDIFSSRIAIGRDDGEIEIVSSLNGFNCIARIAGSVEFKLQALKWSTIDEEAGRLFGISLRGFLFEVVYLLILF